VLFFFQPYLRGEDDRLALLMQSQLLCMLLAANLFAEAPPQKENDMVSTLSLFLSFLLPSVLSFFLSFLLSLSPLSFFLASYPNPFLQVMSIVLIAYLVFGIVALTWSGCLCCCLPTSSAPTLASALALASPFSASASFWTRRRSDHKKQHSDNNNNSNHAPEETKNENGNNANNGQTRSPTTSGSDDSSTSSSNGTRSRRSSSNEDESRSSSEDDDEGDDNQENRMKEYEKIRQTRLAARQDRRRRIQNSKT
jgi:hypothetical protein